MSILSVSFLLFLLGLCVLYFLVPKRFQWWVLLAFSLGFYALGGLLNLPWLLLTALSTWAAARYIQDRTDAEKAFLAAHKAELSKEERSARKAKGKQTRRRVLVLCILLNICVLCAFKYVHFLLAQANALAGLFGSEVQDTIKWIVPLGISFYTFQTVGYLCDVYWGKAKAERNPMKVLLFTSFFPQITQGPISSWNDLSGELFAPHSLDYDNFSLGIQRMIWGFSRRWWWLTSLRATWPRPLQITAPIPAWPPSWGPCAMPLRSTPTSPAIWISCAASARSWASG